MAYNCASSDHFIYEVKSNCNYEIYAQLSMSCIAGPAATAITNWSGTPGMSGGEIHHFALDAGTLELGLSVV